MKGTTMIAVNMEMMHRSAEGTHKLRVLRAHRDFGYWECVFVDGPRADSIWVRSARDIAAEIINVRA